mmetsp:Transcript_11480/g.40863  ORF Transcript_11480/g.40863 Transcript_11480/m.40863 type:complete len:210 (+) Transcript_11480:229-858(+)
MVCLQYRLSELVPNSPSQTGTPPSSPHDSMKPHLSSTSATKTSYSPKRWCKDSNKMRATNDTTKAHKRLETSARMHNACLPPDPPPASGTKGRPCPGETAPANIATPRSTGEAISRMEISRAEASEPSHSVLPESLEQAPRAMRIHKNKLTALVPKAKDVRDKPTTQSIMVQRPTYRGASKKASTEKRVSKNATPGPRTASATQRQVRE